MANKNAKKRAALNKASSKNIPVKKEEIEVKQDVQEQNDQVAQSVDNDHVENAVVVSDNKVKDDKKANKEEKSKDGKDSKDSKEKLDKSKKKKKEKKPSKLAKKTKETFSELKKVSWPTFPTVVKQTGVVLAVVIFFTVVLFGFESLLGWLFSLLTKS